MHYDPIVIKKTYKYLYVYVGVSSTVFRHVRQSISVTIGLVVCPKSLTVPRMQLGDRLRPSVDIPIAKCLSPTIHILPTFSTSVRWRCYF